LLRYFGIFCYGTNSHRMRSTGCVLSGGPSFVAHVVAGGCYLFTNVRER